MGGTSSSQGSSRPVSQVKAQPVRSACMHGSKSPETRGKHGRHRQGQGSQSKSPREEWWATGSTDLKPVLMNLRFREAR